MVKNPMYSESAVMSQFGALAASPSLTNYSVLWTLKVHLQLFEPQETVQLVTQRAREALNDQRETARRALLINKDYFLLPLIITNGCELKSCECVGKK